MEIKEDRIKKIAKSNNTNHSKRRYIVVCQDIECRYLHKHCQTVGIKYYGKVFVCDKLKLDFSKGFSFIGTEMEGIFYHEPLLLKSENL